MAKEVIFAQKVTIVQLELYLGRRHHVLQLITTHHLVRKLNLTAFFAQSVSNAIHQVRLSRPLLHARLVIFVYQTEPKRFAKKVTTVHREW
jgi:hypothetical protein